MNSNNKKKLLYLCGPTVYNHVHIGNLRPIIVFDFLISIWEFFGEKIDFLHNITDIDDKIIEKANQENTSEIKITNYYLNEYWKILDSFNIKRPTKTIRITNAIDKIINYILLLQQKNFTYFDSFGNLIFDTSKIKNYGIISNQKTKFLQSKNLERNSENDFVLWKKTTKGMLFNSPFGKGRPGWHTECAALIFDYFKKKQIDFHGGGQDLIFPHHENENAQHFVLTQKEITKKWLRVGTINFNGKKMSKSLGNIIFAKDFCQNYSPDIIRNIFLTSNPTTPINLTNQLIENHKNILRNYKKQFFNFLIEPKEPKKEVVKEILTFFSNFEFAKANFLISELINKNENATLAEIFKILRFNFAKKQLNNVDKKNLKLQKKYQLEKNYEKSDKFRNLLWKKFIFS